MSPRQRGGIALLFILLALAGCAGEAAPVNTGSRTIPLEVTCHTAYRSSVTVPIEREEIILLTSDEEEGEVAFEELLLRARYTSGESPPFERSLRITVLSSEGEELLGVLYQLGVEGIPKNDFIGGHGFTGLHYVYNPPATAELQFWCVATEA